MEISRNLSLTMFSVVTPNMAKAATTMQIKTESVRRFKNIERKNVQKIQNSYNNVGQINS